MKTKSILLALMVGLLAGATAQADTLLVNRAQSEQGTSLPKRGATMAQVETTFGAPQQKFPAVAGPGSRKRNPPITRWNSPTEVRPLLGGRSLPCLARVCVAAWPG